MRNVVAPYLKLSGILMRFLSVILLFMLVACSPESERFESRTSGQSLSSSGHSAYIVETTIGNGTSNTQVMIDFASGKCGSGAVSAAGDDIGLSLQWVEPEKLVVHNPNGVALTRNASGEMLQCGEQKVHVAIVNPR